jgi:hypothetical protein
VPLLCRLDVVELCHVSCLLLIGCSNRRASTLKVRSVRRADIGRIAVMLCLMCRGMLDG